MRALLLCCFVAATGCGGSVVGPAVPIDQPFTLAVGEAAAIASTSLVIKFTGVTGDSRCPVDALCIQGGDALVHVQLSSGETVTYVLHTGDSTAATITHGRYRISLVELQPYPFSSRTILPGEYRATLTATRL